MPSRLNSPSAEGELEEEVEVTEEEGEVQVTITQVKVRYNKTRIGISSLKEAEGEDQMTKKTCNATTAKSVGTMDLNARRNKRINTQA